MGANPDGSPKSDAFVPLDPGFDAEPNEIASVPATIGAVPPSEPVTLLAPTLNAGSAFAGITADSFIATEPILLTADGLAQTASPVSGQNLPGVAASDQPFGSSGDLDGDDWVGHTDIDDLLGAIQAAEDAMPSESAGNLRGGVTGKDDATGHGYLMYSQERVHNRWPYNPSIGAYGYYFNSADHFAPVQWIDGQWYYQNNDHPLVAFEPADGDVLVAEVDFDNDTIRSLEGHANTYGGIELGYADGDLAFYKDRWGSSVNYGEFLVTGTTFKRNPTDMAGYAAAYDVFSDGKLDVNDANHLIHGLLSTQPGDANLDGAINQADLNAVMNNWGSSTAGWAEGLFDPSGLTVGQSDLNAVLNNWGWLNTNPVEVSGGMGPDILYGYAGNDNIDGGEGDDFLWGDLGDDKLDGGAGTDFYGHVTLDDTISSDLLDQDFDGVSNWHERLVGTDYLVYSDTAGDGFSDDWKTRFGFDPYSVLNSSEDLDGD
ncbi:MAG: hypothetical protein AAF663_05625, partial [Planctomycetota bacterium]